MSRLWGYKDQGLRIIRQLRVPMHKDYWTVVEF